MEDNNMKQIQKQKTKISECTKAWQKADLDERGAGWDPVPRQIIIQRRVQGLEATIGKESRGPEKKSKNNNCAWKLQVTKFRIKIAITTHHHLSSIPRQTSP